MWVLNAGKKKRRRRLPVACLYVFWNTFARLQLSWYHPVELWERVLTVNVYSETQQQRLSRFLCARPRQRQWTEGREAAVEKMRDSTVTGRWNQPSGWREYMTREEGWDGSDCQGHDCGIVIKKQRSAIWKWEIERDVKLREIKKIFHSQGLLGRTKTFFSSLEEIRKTNFFF